MSDAHLRDLFRAAAPEVEGHDPLAVDRAWRDGSRRRAGSSAAVVGSVAAAAAVVGTVGVLDRPVGQVSPAPAPGSSTATPTPTSPSPSSRPDTTYAGAPLWWAPSAAEESDLPRLSVASLPPVIDLAAASRGPVGEPVSALFWGWREDQVFVLTARHRVVELDTSALEPVSDEAGNEGGLLSSYSLASDGRRAFFVQSSSVEVLDFVTGEWTSIDTPDWLAEGARWLGGDIWVPDELGETSGGTVYPVAGGPGAPSDVDWPEGPAGPGEGAWGPVASSEAGTAQSVFLAGGVTGGSVGNPQAIVVERGGERHVLALDYGYGDDGTRFKGCCIALGWLDRDTVLFATSGSEGQRVLAWSVGSDRVHLVSEIVGRGSIHGWVPAS